MSNNNEVKLILAHIPEHNKRLLQIQINMLAVRTKFQWQLGKDGQSQCVTLVYDSKTKTGIANIKCNGSIYKLQLELPSRLFGVLTFLLELEKILSIEHKDTHPKSISSVIAKLNPEHEYGVFVEENLIVISPAKKTIISDIANSQDLVRLLLSTPNDVKFVKKSNFNSSGIHHDLKKIIWSLALLEPLGYSKLPHDMDNLEYHIDYWPELGSWTTSSQIIRLASLFTRDFFSISEASEFSQSTNGYVSSFLHACEVCELGLKSRKAGHNKENKENKNLQLTTLIKKIRIHVGFI